MTAEQDQMVLDVKNCIVKYKIRDIIPCINKALEAGIPASRILDDGMISGMNDIGEGFKKNEIYMPQMLIAAKAMQAGLTVLEPLLKASSDGAPKGKAIVGSVLGDVHDIGKNLVTVMLQGAGLDVHDLGADVPPEKFLEMIENDPSINVVACSSSMTPTRDALKTTVDMLNASDKRGNFGIFVGGATMDQQFSDEIKADVYTADAASAAERVKQYISGTDLNTVGEDARKAAYDAIAAKNASSEEDSAEPVFHRHLEPPRIKQLKAEGKYTERAPLTQYENVLEMLKHDEGCPDALVNQYFFEIPFDPVLCGSRNLAEELFNPQPVFKDAWGVSHSNPKGSAGSHPLEDEGLLVITDITKWKEQVKTQGPLEFPEEAWAMSDGMVADIRARGKPVGIWFAPGLFERTHFLLGMNAALTAYYEHPKEMHELIDWIVDWEIRAIDVLWNRYHPEVLFHHDDWGSAINSFLDPATHREFFLEPYKKIFAHFKAIGGQVVVHHSDSYAANLVPIQIDAGADIWQGPVSANNIAELIDKYGDKIVFMGGIDNAEIDFPGKTDEEVEAFVRGRIKDNGCRSYIPCLTRGLYMSITPGIYEKVTAAIDKISKEMF